MTTNKPEIACWGSFYKGVMQDFGYNEEATKSAAKLDFHGRKLSIEPLVRLSDYERLQADTERLQADTERLQAECEQLRKDAERYRWLKPHLYVVDTYSGKGISYEVGIDGAEVPDIDDVTEAIDAAMQEPSHDNQ